MAELVGDGRPRNTGVDSLIEKMFGSGPSQNVAEVVPATEVAVKSATSDLIALAAADPELGSGTELNEPRPATESLAPQTLSNGGNPPGATDGKPSDATTGDSSPKSSETQEGATVPDGVTMQQILEANPNLAFTLKDGTTIPLSEAATLIELRPNYNRKMNELHNKTKFVERYQKKLDVIAEHPALQAAILAVEEGRSPTEALTIGLSTLGVSPTAQPKSADVTIDETNDPRLVRPDYMTEDHQDFPEWYAKYIDAKSEYAQKKANAPVLQAIGDMQARFKELDDKAKQTEESEKVSKYNTSGFLAAFRAHGIEYTTLSEEQKDDLKNRIENAATDNQIDLAGELEKGRILTPLEWKALVAEGLVGFAQTKPTPAAPPPPAPVVAAPAKVPSRPKVPPTLGQQGIGVPGTQEGAPRPREGLVQSNVARALAAWE